MKSIEIIAIQPILQPRTIGNRCFGEHYRNRGDSENRIKELKADFGPKVLTLKAFSLQKLHLYFR